MISTWKGDLSSVEVDAVVKNTVQYFTVYNPSSEVTCSWGEKYSHRWRRGACCPNDRPSSRAGQHAESTDHPARNSPPKTLIKIMK